MSEARLHFVLSAPRSGSTWLATALNHHPQVFATEHRLFGEFFEVWRNPNGTSSPRITLDAYVRAMAGHYFHGAMGMDHGEFFRELLPTLIDSLVEFGLKRSGKSIIVDKITPYPGTSDRVVQRIRQFVPSAKVILLTRDGRDVVTSGVFDWIHREDATSPRHRLFAQGQSGMRLERFFDDQTLAEWARLWMETIQTGRERKIDGHVTYEQMQTDHPSALQQLFSILGVDEGLAIANQCAEASTFQAMTGRESGAEQPLAKARKGIVGDWKNYFTRRDGQLFWEIAGEAMQYAGYERDDRWVRALPETLELTQASHVR